MKNSGKVYPIEILLIEDNPGDVKLTQLALSEIRVHNNLNVVTNGVDAIDYIYQNGQYKDAPRPDIILLDLNLPKKDGREVLKELKSDDNFKRIPIVVLTSSKAEEDILRSYDLHANCYITKPLDLLQFFEIIKSIENFWLTIVKLPIE